MNEINSDDKIKPNDKDNTINNQPKKVVSPWIVISLIIIGVALLYYSRVKQSSLPADIGNPSSGYDLTFTDLQNSQVSLRQYIGKSVILVNNFATWCPPCKAEMPELESYFNKYKTKDFIIIAIESGDEQKEVMKFVQSNNISFPVWTDPETKAINYFKGRGLPFSFVIDKKGNIRQNWTGGIDQRFLESYVTPILNE